MNKISDQKIIDAHHHLWDPTSNKYNWLKEPDNEVLNKIYLLDDFYNDSQGLNLIKSVHVQADINLNQSIEETNWLQNMTENLNFKNINLLPNAIIGFADFLDIDVEKNIIEHLKSKNFRGIRQILNYDKNNKSVSHANIDYLKDDKWIKNFSLLDKYNLSFDLSILYNQAKNAADLINKEDRILFIINHTLSPIISNNDNFKDWLDSIKLLSSFENVVIKLSGFGEFNSNWTEESIRPLILNSIDNFGINRCMFGSNFPVDKYLSSPSYFDYWNSYFNIVEDFSDDEKNKLFYMNAENFYKIKDK